jgi:hypothetical protein
VAETARTEHCSTWQSCMAISHGGLTWLKVTDKGARERDEERGWVGNQPSTESWWVARVCSAWQTHVAVSHG